MGKFLSKKSIVYLDQFAVSNIVDNSSSQWNKISFLITKGVSEQKIICPNSFEHLLETSKRHEEPGVNQYMQFHAISNGYRLLDEQTVTTKCMISLMRNKKFSQSTFLLKENPFSIKHPDILNDFKTLARAFDDINNEAFELVNKIRQIERSKNRPQKTLNLSGLDHYRVSYLLNLTTRLDSYSHTGTFKKTPIILPSVTLPFWADAIMELLISDFKISRKEARIGKKLLEKEGLKIIPALYVRTAMEWLMVIKNKNENTNSHIDVMRLTVAIPFSDVVLIDRERSYDIKSLGLDKMYNTLVYSGHKTEIDRFISKLEELVDN